MFIINKKNIRFKDYFNINCKINKINIIILVDFLKGKL